MVLALVRAFDERNDGDRRAQLRHRHGAGLDHGAWSWWADAIGADRLLHVLEIARAQILDIGIKHRGELIADIRGHNDFARPCEARETRGKIDSRTIDIVAVRDHMTGMQAHTQHDVLTGQDAIIDLQSRALQGKGGFHRRRHHGKFEQQAVAMALDETATVRGQYFPFDDADEVAPPLHDAAFVLFHKPNGFDHVGEQQCPRDPFGSIQRVGALDFNHVLRHRSEAPRILGHGFAISKADPLRLRHPRTLAPAETRVDPAAGKFDLGFGHPASRFRVDV